MAEYSTSETYTMMQLFAILQNNGVHIETSMLSWKAMCNAVRDNNIYVPQKQMVWTEQDDAPVWFIEKWDAEIYCIGITYPATFVIMVGDIFIAPNKQTFKISKIEIADPDMWYLADTNTIKLGCRVVMENVDDLNKTEIYNSATDFMHMFNCTDITYIRSRWFDIWNSSFNH